MRILTHRGYWSSPDERNGEQALRRSRASGFGTETDVRDCNGELVISHDPPVGGEVSLAALLEIYGNSGLTLALNVKADGLALRLKAVVEASAVDCFAFDMSAPEQLRYARAGIRTFTRHSDIEPEPILYAEAAGVWLDAFNSEWFDRAVIKQHLTAGKQVCVVSPELHGRPVEPVWNWLFTADVATSNDLYLCTDRPDEAERQLVTSR